MEYAGKGPIMKYDEDNGEFSINEHYIDKSKKDPTDFTEEEIKDLIRDLLCGLHYCKYDKALLILTYIVS